MRTVGDEARWWSLRDHTASVSWVKAIMVGLVAVLRCCTDRLSARWVTSWSSQYERWWPATCMQQTTISFYSDTRPPNGQATEASKSRPMSHATGRGYVSSDVCNRTSCPTERYATYTFPSEILLLPDLIPTHRVIHRDVAQSHRMCGRGTAPKWTIGFDESGLGCIPEMASRPLRVPSTHGSYKRGTDRYVQTRGYLALARLARSLADPCSCARHRDRCCDRGGSVLRLQLGDGDHCIDRLGRVGPRACGRSQAAPAPVPLSSRGAPGVARPPGGHCRPV
jgi:hypothetical protein